MVRGISAERGQLLVSIVLLSLLATLAIAQTKADEAAIRKVLEDEVTTWNRGDADGYSRHFAVDGAITSGVGERRQRLEDHRVPQRRYKNPE